MILFLGIITAQGQEVQGFAEVRANWSVGVDGFPLQFVERFRPTFDAPLSDRVHLGVTVEAAVAQGRDTPSALRGVLEDSPFGPLLTAANCEWPTFDNAVFRTNDVGDYLFVDRLYVDYYNSGFDLRVGRQALQWGSALFINPTDPFPQVLFTEPWRPRSGVNSARITVPVGDLHQVQAVVGTDDDFTATRIAGRATVNALQTDWSLIGAWRQEADEVLVGADIKGTAGVGFWLEGAVRFTGVTEDPKVAEQIAVGLDYSFPVLQSFIIAAQYLRNGGTQSGAAAAFTIVGGPVCDDGGLFGEAAEPDPFAPFLSGTDYGLLSIGLGATPDLSISGGWLQNLGDGSGIVIPSLSLRLPAGFDVSLSAQLPLAVWGNGEFKPAPDDLKLAVPGVGVADLAGLVPDAGLFLWTRLNF